MRIFIAEKKHAVEQIVKHGITDKDDVILVTFSLGLWIESIPNLSFKQIPYTELPSEYRSHPELLSKREHYHAEGWIKCRAHAYDGEGRPLISFVPTNDGLNNYEAMLQGIACKAEEIVIATDDDERGAYGAKQYLDRMNLPSEPPVSCILTYMLHSNSEKVWAERSSRNWETSGYQALASRQSIKRLFEYWWNCNSALVFGELCKKSGLNAARVITKFELLAMLFVATMPEKFKPDELIKRMDKWKGTGRFQDKATLGSTSSYSEIFEKMLQRGHLSRDEKHACSLTPAGQRFVSLCHPRTFDIDLPMRLESWMNDGDIGPMRRYINTLFSRQLRYQRKNENIES